MNWFYESAGQQQGPVTEPDLDRLLAEGKISPETLVWREGLADWQPLRIARPASGATPPPSPFVDLTKDIPPGYVKCALTGKVIPESEAIFIQGKPYSPEAKPQVLHSLQSGGHLPTADDANRTGPAWEKREELGIVTAAWETIKGVLMEPSATFSNMKREGGLGAPISFYLLVGSLGMAFVQICLFAAMVSGVLPQGNPALAGQPDTVGKLVTTLIFIPFQVVLGAFFLSGITHVALMICGGANRPFEATFRTLCYAWGAASALYFIPVCGWVAAAIWGLVAQCIGLARVHEINTGRAVLAVFLPWIICCAVIAVGAILIAAFAGQAGAFSQ